MGFSIGANLTLEYRGMQSGVGKESGKPWMSLVCEDNDARQVQLTVPQDMQSEIYNLGLRKGDMISVHVLAVAFDQVVNGRARNYVTCQSVPVLVDSETGEIGGGF